MPEETLNLSEFFDRINQRSLPLVKHQHKGGFLWMQTKTTMDAPLYYGIGKRDGEVEFQFEDHKVRLSDVSLSQIFHAMHEAAQNPGKIVDITPEGLKNIKDKYESLRKETLREGDIRDTLRKKPKQLKLF